MSFETSRFENHLYLEINRGNISRPLSIKKRISNKRIGGFNLNEQSATNYFGSNALTMEDCEFDDEFARLPQFGVSTMADEYKMESNNLLFSNI